MRHGVVVEELTIEVMAQLPTDQARKEVMALVEAVRIDCVGGKQQRVMVSSGNA
jgi:hypothetical protein